MGRIGALLAFWANARCPFFIEHALRGVNLWDEFARQDETEVRHRTSELSWKGQRPVVAVPKAKREAKLRELVRIVARPGPVDETEMSGWAASVEASNVATAGDGL
jgi:hypothetical protein